MVIAVTATAALAAVVCLFHRATNQATITATIREITMTATQDTVDRIVTQLAKAKSEIIAKITDLQNQIDAGTPAEQLDLGPLTDIAQALDDINPDPTPADQVDG